MLTEILEVNSLSLKKEVLLFYLVLTITATEGLVDLEDTRVREVNQVAMVRMARTELAVRMGTVVRTELVVR
ncbi:Hypothetical protein POVR2_LOCUS138 [uncultured virus]|nr:Hypothetical protein POVR2_LOCUS138 [uncultured virus]